MQFSFSIYPSTARPGSHAIAISSHSDESVVIGFTQDPDLTKQQISDSLNTDSSWSDEGMYHKLVVPISLNSNSRCERLK